MTQVGGLDVLLAAGLFVLLLGVLAWFVLRSHTDPIDEAHRSTGEQGDGPPSER